MPEPPARSRTRFLGESRNFTKASSACSSFVFVAIISCMSFREVLNMSNGMYELSFFHNKSKSLVEISLIIRLRISGLEEFTDFSKLLS